MKKLSLLLAVFLLVIPTVVLGQTLAHPGCVLAWDAPMMEDPNNPGTLISAWANVRDRKGFVFNTRKDALHTWDKLLEQWIADPSLLQIDCPTIGVEDLGEYSVGIVAQDNSLNLSPEVWITFTLVAQDNSITLYR